MKSILQSVQRCYFCGSTSVEKHHIYFGGLRPTSERMGFTAWLCPYHHRDAKHGVHGCRALDLKLKEACQEVYEQTHTRAEWMKLIGRNYRGK